MTDKPLPDQEREDIARLMHRDGCDHSRETMIAWECRREADRLLDAGLRLDAARVAPSDGLDAAALERAFVAVIDRRPLRVEVAYHYGADIPVEHQRQAFLRDVVTEYARVAAPSDGLRERILKLSDASEGRGEWLLGWQAAIEAAADIAAAAPTADPGGPDDPCFACGLWRRYWTTWPGDHEHRALAATPTEDQPVWGQNPNNGNHGRAVRPADPGGLREALRQVRILAEDRVRRGDTDGWPMVVELVAATPTEDAHEEGRPPLDPLVAAHDRGWSEGFIAGRDAARVAAPSDGLREAVESITRTTQRPAGRGPYVEHEVDEGHAPGEPCRFCDALAATEQPETGREYCVICGSDAHHGDEHNDAIRYAHPEVEA